MNATLPPFSRRRLPALLALLVTALLGTGCSGAKSTHLTVRSLDQRQTFQTQFPRAFAGKSSGGDYDVVLVKEGAAPRAGGRDVRQVLHVRVLWKPMKGTKLDHPTATNATLDWVVWDDAARGFIAYSGAGFVDVQRKGGTAVLDIRSATLSPLAKQGPMNDPIGRAQVMGTIVARTDPRQVSELLEDVRETVGAAQQARHPQAGARSASSSVTVDQ
jgi:hypothetical protein